MTRPSGNERVKRLDWIDLTDDFLVPTSSEKKLIFDWIIPCTTVSTPHPPTTTKPKAKTTARSTIWPFVSFLHRTVCYRSFLTIQMRINGTDTFYSTHGLSSCLCFALETNQSIPTTWKLTRKRLNSNNNKKKKKHMSESE